MHGHSEKLQLSDDWCMAVKFRQGLDFGGEASSLRLAVVSGVMGTVWGAMAFGAHRMELES